MSLRPNFVEIRMSLIKVVGIDNWGKLELPFLFYLEVKCLSFDIKTNSNVLASPTFCSHIINELEFTNFQNSQIHKLFTLHFLTPS